MLTDPEEEGCLSGWVAWIHFFHPGSVSPLTSAICPQPQPVLQRSVVVQHFRHFSPRCQQLWHKSWPLCSIYALFHSNEWDPTPPMGRRKLQNYHLKRHCRESWRQCAMPRSLKKDLKIAAVAPGWCVIARRSWKGNKPWHVWAAHPAGRSAIAQLSLVLTRVRFGGGGHKRLICERTATQLHVIAQNTTTRVIS